MIKIWDVGVLLLCAIKLFHSLLEGREFHASLRPAVPSNRAIHIAFLAEGRPDRLLAIDRPLQRQDFVISSFDERSPSSTALSNVNA